MTGYPTPAANEFEPRDLEAMDRRRQECKERTGNGNGFGLTLGMTVAGYNTPRATDGTHGGPNQSGGALPAAVAGYVTPSTRDFKDTPGMSTTGTNPDGSERTRNDQLPRQIHGLITPSDTTETARPGVLAQEFSLGLMGYPARKTTDEWARFAPGYSEWESVQTILRNICHEQGSTELDA